VSKFAWALTTFRHYDPDLTKHVARAITSLLQLSLRYNESLQQQQQQQLAHKALTHTPSVSMPTASSNCLATDSSSSSSSSCSSSSNNSKPASTCPSPPPFIDPEHLASLLHSMAACSSYQPGLYNNAARLLVDQLDALDMEQLVQVSVLSYQVQLRWVQQN